MTTETCLKTVLLIGFAASLALVARLYDASNAAPRWMFWLIWPAMVLHQCEENVFTELVIGREWTFTRWVRSVGYDISTRRALALNVGVGWTLAILAGIVGPIFSAIPLFVAAVEAVNGFWHLSTTALTRRWSPGTLTGVVLAIPLAFFLFHICLNQGLTSPWLAFAIFLGACVSHHLFLNSLPRVKS